MKAIILAGGEGTRLWPLSRGDFPKQFLNFGSGLSLLQKTVRRLLNAPFIDQVVVATNEHHFSLVQAQLEKIDAECLVLVEPLRKNTASAVGYAIKVLQTQYNVAATEPLLVVPSDLMIEPEIIFLHALEQINQTTVLSKKVITFGIRPTKPETGYAYIEIGKKWDGMAFEAIRFIEKPDRQTAEKYVGNPLFFWNSGMYLFSIQTFWEQLQKHSPSLSALFQMDLAQVTARFNEMPNFSFDYAIMEKSKDVLVCPLAVSWSDVGSWDSVYEVMEKDQNQNVKIGQVLAIDTTNSLIFGGKRIISTIGLDDLLIVETEDAVLISKKGESQRVKAVLQEVKSRFNKE